MNQLTTVNTKGTKITKGYSERLYPTKIAAVSQPLIRHSPYVMRINIGLTGLNIDK